MSGNDSIGQSSIFFGWKWKKKYEFNQCVFRNTFIDLDGKTFISGQNQEIPAIVIMNCFNTEMILDR